MYIFRFLIFLFITRNFVLNLIVALIVNLGLKLEMSSILDSIGSTLCKCTFLVLFPVIFLF